MTFAVYLFLKTVKQTVGGAVVKVITSYKSYCAGYQLGQNVNTFGVTDQGARTSTGQIS